MNRPYLASLSTRTLMLTFCTALFSTGCGGCNAEPERVLSSPVKLSERGETCLATNDCVEGLACVGSVCVSRDLNVEPSSKECFLLECTQDDDCCPEPSAQCIDAQQRCAAEGAGSFACDEIDFYCFECDATCTANRCVVSGGMDACENDDDCFFDDQVCRSGSCEEVCQTDANCGLFQACQNDECVDVGCSSNRECIAATRDDRARCIDKLCTISCTADSDCTVGGAYSVCDNGQCVSAGCETDQECRAILDFAFVDGTANVECREP